MKFCTATAAFLILCVRAQAADNDLAAVPEPGSVLISDGGELYLGCQVAAWGPGWSFMKMSGKVSAREGTTQQTLAGKDKKSGAELKFDWVIRKSGPRQLTYVMALSTPKDAKLTCAVAGFDPGEAFEGGSLAIQTSDGKSETLPLPLGKGGVGKAVRKAVFTDGDARTTTLTFDPPIDLAGDVSLRVLLTGTEIVAAKPIQETITIDLPEEITYYPTLADMPDEPGLSTWYTWAPKQDYDQPSVIAMDNWSPEPAGAKGRITRQGGDLLYAGQPTKFWGLNACYGACLPTTEKADQEAKFFRKYGINTVRLHKYADGAGKGGIQSADSTAEFNPENLDRMDYFIAKLKEAGISVELSAQFGVIAIGPKDLRDVPYAEEFGQFGGGKKAGRIATPGSVLPFSPEILNLHIRQITNLLAHKNPYTGKTYAEEPAILALEIVNENSVLFHSSMKPLRQSPTLRKIVGKKFGDFLRARYGAKDKLLATWGQEAFNSFGAEGFAKEGEDLDQDNILPLGSPWFWDPANLDTTQTFRKRRLLDSLEFLCNLQIEAYQRWVDAVRKVGYTGEIVASNWQAGQNTSHYYNLYSDYMVGLIDRHNYFKGSHSMLAVPGSGMLSAGMQQVSDRPFMLSEWIHTYPGEWHAEGPAIIGAYGMGLQDWDVSYMFQNGDNGGFSEMLKAKWNVTEPPILALFPAIARQVRRQDVKPADVVAQRYVNMASLREAKLGFTDKVIQEYDIKSFDSDKVPAKSLAVAKCVVEFTDQFKETPQFDPEKFRKDGAYVSSTGQLRWTPGKDAYDGHFTMDTPATKAVVGFADGKTCPLGEVTITPATHFAAIYVTAKDPGETIQNAKSVLVVAVARAHNTGMKWLGSKKLLTPGKAPILMEPVKATIKITRPGKVTVHVLDQDGKRTDQTLPVTDGTFTIDGAATKTPYYEVVYE